VAKKIFGEWNKNVEEVNNKFDEQDEDADEVVEEIRNEPDAPVDSEEKIHETKLLHEIKKLQGWFNPEASRIVE
jgi:hypothetical protein